MKLLNLVWILALILIISSSTMGEYVSTCYINEGLTCEANNCVEAMSSSNLGEVHGASGDQSWVYMRFDENTCSNQYNYPVDFENSSITKGGTLYWWVDSSCASSGGIDSSTLEVCSLNGNGDASIEYCTDNSVLHGGSCTNTEDEYENLGDSNNQFTVITSCDEGTCCSGIACSTSASIYTNNDNEDYLVHLIKPSSGQVECFIQYSLAGGVKPKVEVTSNYGPTMQNCPDAYTMENGDGSDVSVDLWGCHSDPDDEDSSNTFTIYSESDTGLIDCNITSNQYLLCNPPAINKSGFSDVVVKVDDGYEIYTDTIRVVVYPEHEVSIYINETEAWSGYSYDNVDVDMMLELQDYLEVCENDIQGNCLVPVKIESHNNPVELSINSIDVNYNLYELDFKDALQNYLDNTCTDSNCSVPLTFSLDSEGLLNLTDLQVFYTLYEITLGNKTFYVNDASGNAMASFDDNGNLELLGTCSVTTCDDISSALFVVKDSGDGAVAYIDNSGNLCLETGDCSGNSASCNAPDNSFVVRNALDSDVAYIDSTGDLCLTGSLIESGNP